MNNSWRFESSRAHHFQTIFPPKDLGSRPVLWILGRMKRPCFLSVLAYCLLFWSPALSVSGQGNEDHETLRVFIFAGQSNMVGSDSKVGDIKRFPPYAGLENPQEKVLFNYWIGWENKRRSEGWVALQPVN